MTVSIFDIIDIVDIKVQDKKLQNCNFYYNKTKYNLVNLTNENLNDVYSFFKKFNDLEKNFFPYPLFKPIDLSFDYFKKKFSEYTKEKSWVYFLLYNNNSLIGVTLLKKIGFLNTDSTEYKSPTSGIYISKESRGKKIGLMLQKFVTFQAKLLNLDSIFIRVSSQNLGSQKIYDKCGFKKTGNVYSVIKDSFEWTDEEYVLDLQNN